MGRTEAAAMIPGIAMFWVAVLGGAAPHTPRLRLSFQELQARHGLRTFRLERTCCYEALLLDEERGRLFVGAENHVASLSLDNISKRAKKLAWPAPVEWREECNWAGKDIGTECMNFVKLLHAYNRTHLLACGTGAFHPTCAFVEVGHRLEEPMLRLDLQRLEDGKGRSPYDPRHRAASVLVGEELYSGVAADLMGRDFTIFRSLGQRPSLRTEPHDSRWLNGERLVGLLGGCPHLQQSRCCVRPIRGVSSECSRGSCPGSGSALGTGSQGRQDKYGHALFKFTGLRMNTQEDQFQRP